MRSTDIPFVTIERQEVLGKSYWYTEDGNQLKSDRVVAAGDAAACMSAYRLLTGRWDAHR